ncbi:MAG: Structural maintenance of chromosomes protein 5 [Marteilia pararefringens]
MAMRNSSLFSTRSSPSSSSASTLLTHSIPGSISRIVIKNFLTYSHLDVKPGPNLNIIIGPNGSGKSSIILAIALGLGGKPSNLGRSKHIYSFIKQGKSEAEICITLISHDLTPVAVRRIISHSKNNEWFLNNKPSSMSDVVKLVHSLNIRIDNLIQFLPQDKVTQFSKMTNIEILRSTQMAIGAETLIVDHNTLIELNKKYQEIDQTQKSDISRLDLKEQRIAQIGVDVEKLKELKKNQNLLHVLKIKHAWLKYNAKATELSDIKSQISSHESQIAELQQSIKNAGLNLQAFKDSNFSKEADSSVFYIPLL